MSVWATFWAADGDDHADDCAVWERIGDHAVRRGPGPCSCGLPDAPIAYQGSHVLPGEDDRRAGSVQLAEVPSHITRDGRDDGPDDGVTPWPYLRLSLGQEDVVLDERLARSLRDALDGWLQARTVSAAP